MREEVMTVKIIKMIDEDGQPSHWAADVFGVDGQVVGMVTGPTFYGVWDTAYEFVTGDEQRGFDNRHNEWVDFDANDRHRQKDKR